ncbi:MAG: hypothetical protein OXC30_05630, partial [Alphaproteobacteria bacterium]|nr:hypothetical protein [Alphaproteobacteria bacterium]
RNWKESIQDLFPQGESNDEVDLTGDTSNIENDSTSSHSQLKKSLNDDTKKTMSRRSLSQQQYRDSEIILRLRGNVAAIFRYQIRLRQNRHKTLSCKEDAQTDVNELDKEIDELDKEIDELKELASAEGADLKPERLQIIQDWKDSQSQVTAGKEARPKISEKFKVIEALRELTKYQLEDGKAVLKKSKSRVTDDQGRGVWTGEANREWRDDGKYRASEAQESITAMARSGVISAWNLDGLTQGVEVGSDPFLAGPVSGGVTSDDTDVIERAKRVIASELRNFLIRGNVRVSTHQEVLAFTEQKKKREGVLYSVINDPCAGKLASFKATRRHFFLSLVQKTQLETEQIAEIIQGLPKQSSDAEESEVQHLLGVRQGLESDARNKYTTVAEMAKHEAEKAQRKRTALAGPVSGGVTSDATDVIERAKIVIENELRHFLIRGHERVSNHQEVLKLTEQKKKREGALYAVRNDSCAAQLASFKSTRRHFLLSLVHQTQLKIEQIVEIIQGLPKQSSDAEESDVQHLLGVRKGLESDARDKHTTVAEMAKHEAEKAQRKRTAASDATKERATSQKKRCS